MDAAINHFIEAGNSDKAIQAAIGAQQWKKAQLILDQSDSPSNAQYYRQIANHYNQTKQFEAAAKMMIKVKLRVKSKVDGPCRLDKTTRKKNKMNGLLVQKNLRRFP